MGAPVKWSPEGKSQDDFMLKDECIVLNYMDEVVGHDNKYNCHKFIPGQPRGLLHRAFSVMLFDSNNRLLLQQRAASKITFPNVWTNTCCSHPLHGMDPPEVDTPEAIAAGDPIGAKHAAVRKLAHELGIPEAELDVTRFKFTTRVHYWAADAITYGPDAPWGEHEIDILLLYRLKPNEELTLRPNPDEVMAVKWLSHSEVKAAMAGGEDTLAKDMPLWSPWFRIIAQRFLDDWWQDLDAALSTDKYLDASAIHRFDCGPEHHGGAGGARPWLDGVAEAEAAAVKLGDEAQRRAIVLAKEHEDRIAGVLSGGNSKIKTGADGVKQGAYGKVPTHGHSKLDQLLRPLEVVAGLRLKYGGLLQNNLTKQCEDPDIAFCDDMLVKVSRSFAAVIRQLPADLCVDICVFYLVLRALDTVEDDMEAYKDHEADKEAELRSFGAKRLTDPQCSIEGVGAGDERTLIMNFGRVVRVFNMLPKGSQEVVRDITDKMGAGMADYVRVDLGQGTIDKAAYDRYCHMVAGLVGEGLTRIFIARGAEQDGLSGQGEHVWQFCADAKVQPSNLGMANSMGLFLQKANIIRDYLEDYVDGRAFWPQSVWRQFTTTNDLGEFARPTAHGAGLRLPMPGDAGKVAAKGVGLQALFCVNELIADALELVPDCLAYLAQIQTPSIYCFCAIPQVMAMATLFECFDNPKMFTGVIKIRKGLTASLICGCIEGQDAVHWWFHHFAQRLAASVSSGVCTGADGPTGKRVARACERIIERTASHTAKYDTEQSVKKLKLLGVGVVCIAATAAVLRS